MFYFGTLVLINPRARSRASNLRQLAALPLARTREPLAGQLFCKINVFSSFLVVPLIINQTNKVKGSTVKVTWKQGSCPVQVAMYTVYYREAIRGSNGSRWRAVNVSQFANHYNLKLKCYKEYEITVTAWSEYGETPLNQSKLWKVKTGGGIKLQSNLYFYISVKTLAWSFCIQQVNNNSSRNEAVMPSVQGL